MDIPHLRRAVTGRGRADPRWSDIGTAAGTLLVGLVLIGLGITDTWTDVGLERLARTSPWWHVLFLVVGCAALLVKRRRPVFALLVGVVAVAADLVFGGSIGIALVLFDLLFAAGLFAGARARNAVLTVVFVGVGTTSVVAGLAAGDLRVVVLVALQLTGLLVIPIWWAGNIRQQQELTALARGEAVHAERSAMARDLHDVIAGHLAGTAIHAGAALSLPPDQDRDRAALRAVRTSSLAALDEMRSMIVLLRGELDPGEERPVAPAQLDRLDELLATARGNGLRVRAEVELDVELPALVSQAAYRIVQEALSNTAKHAPGAAVLLSVAVRGDDLVIEVVNPLPADRELCGPVLGTRTGLWSMRERADLIGGSLAAGRDGAHWRVRAALPVRAPAGVAG